MSNVYEDNSGVLGFLGILVFFSIWFYCVDRYGVLMGLGLGWFPAFIAAYLSVLLAPLAFVIFVIFFIAYQFNVARAESIIKPFGSIISPHSPPPTLNPQRTYDPSTGSIYETKRSYGGAITQGYNPSTGSRWSIQSDNYGNMSGVNASGERWSYDRSTGYYNQQPGKQPCYMPGLAGCH